MKIQATGENIFQVLLTYNSTEHSTTQIKPNEAGKKDNHLWVNWHLQNAAKRNRKHPDTYKRWRYG